MAAQEYTPITPRKGGLVHALMLDQPTKTACDTPCRGWRIALEELTCADCKAAVFMDVRPKKRARRRT